MPELPSLLDLRGLLLRLVLVELGFSREGIIRTMAVAEVKSIHCQNFGVRFQVLSVGAQEQR